MAHRLNLPEVLLIVESNLRRAGEVIIRLTVMAELKRLQRQ